MKNNFLIISILVILTIAIGLLFWHGERTIEKAKDSGTTIVFFNNLSNNLNESALAFTLQNNEPQKMAYKIEYYLNDEAVGSLETKISTKESLEIKPKIDFKKLGEEVDFVIKVTWNNNQEEIGKRLKINNNN